MAAVMAAMETVIQLMSKCWELMTSNPLLALCVAAGLLPIGISIFTALRNAARGGPGKGAGPSPAPPLRRYIMLGIVRLFDLTLWQLLAVPELALFLGMALLLIIIGIFSWIVRRGKRM